MTVRPSQQAAHLWTLATLTWPFLARCSEQSAGRSMRCCRELRRRVLRTKPNRFLCNRVDSYHSRATEGRFNTHAFHHVFDLHRLWTLSCLAFAPPFGVTKGCRWILVGETSVGRLGEKKIEAGGERALLAHYLKVALRPGSPEPRALVSAFGPKTVVVLLASLKNHEEVLVSPSSIFIQERSLKTDALRLFSSLRQTSFKGSYRSFSHASQVTNLDHEVLIASYVPCANSRSFGKASQSRGRSSSFRNSHSFA